MDGFRFYLPGNGAEKADGRTIFRCRNRETVSTGRVSQANLLQALELTNGTKFDEAIRRGALSWKEKYPDAMVMVREIYRNALGRVPATEEEAIALKALGQQPSEADVQDFIWAMTLHPEFQLIY